MTDDIDSEVTPSEVAIDELIEMLQSPNFTVLDSDKWFHRMKTESLAMMWPSLAAVLADLLQANGRAVPRAFRFARIALIEERNNGSRT